jgi:hypothetical protein
MVTGTAWGVIGCIESLSLTADEKVKGSIPAPLSTMQSEDICSASLNRQDCSDISGLFIGVLTLLIPRMIITVCQIANGGCERVLSKCHLADTLNSNCINSYTISLSQLLWDLKFEDCPLAYVCITA